MFIRRSVSLFRTVGSHRSNHINLGALIIPLLFTMMMSSAAIGSSRVMLEVVGNTQTRQLYINGFEKLERNDKILAYYLTRAGIAGRDIYYDQNYSNALRIRNLFEELVVLSRYFNSEMRLDVRSYLHRFWINSCQYDHFTHKKFTPDFTASELLTAIKTKSHINKALNIEEITQYIIDLQNDIFDSTYLPLLTIKQQTGVDILQHSANNLYVGVSVDEIDAWERAGLERYPANSRVTKEGDHIAEHVYRIGDDVSGIPPGLYADPLQQVVYFLEKAYDHASIEQQRMIENLIHFYKTGENKYMNESIIHWLQNESEVDFLQGFIEVYLDPRGKKGTFQSVVYFNDPHRTSLMKQLVDLAPYFESKAPFPDEFKRKDFDPKPKVQAVLLISGAGDAGAIPPAGINLPNDQKFSELYGSKNLIFTNVMGISGGNNYIGDRNYIRRFVYDFFHPLDIKELNNISEDANFAMVCLHELIGHGSGSTSDSLSAQISYRLKEYYATIEEARAELMALWSIHDPRLQQIGLVDNPISADEIFRQWARYYLLKLAHMENRTTIQEDHERARHLIMDYIFHNSNALVLNKIKGEMFIKITSIDAFQQAVGELLRKVMTIKANGDYEAAKELIETYGIKINRDWRDHMVQRYKEIRKKRPVIESFGFSMPILQPQYNRKGEIVDVEVKYLQDFEKEQLHYSKFYLLQ
ncbi:hypothetical protein JXB12_01730 [candidate division KSB1 bacterium]|nr:hypothetical protein [candidate division KSB1 bacterium]